jgi:hypothetical protein
MVMESGIQRLKLTRMSMFFVSGCGKEIFAESVSVKMDGQALLLFMKK